MGRTATVIAVSYGIVALLSIALALAVWLSTRMRGRSADTALLARREKSWLWIAVGLLVALLFATIFVTPYGESAPANKQVVRVTGFQFAWTFEPAVVRANVPVEFELTTPDVNHSFAVYDDDGVLLVQAQVVPERTQKLVYTFRKPGRYDVLCLEFCGFAHDVMRSTIEVKGSD